MYLQEVKRVSISLNEIDYALSAYTFEGLLVGQLNLMELEVSTKDITLD